MATISNSGDSIEARLHHRIIHTWLWRIFWITSLVWILETAYFFGIYGIHMPPINGMESVMIRMVVTGYQLTLFMFVYLVWESVRKTLKLK